MLEVLERPWAELVKGTTIPALNVPQQPPKIRPSPIDRWNKSLNHAFTPLGSAASANPQKGLGPASEGGGHPGERGLLTPPRSRPPGITAGI